MLGLRAPVWEDKKMGSDTSDGGRGDAGAASGLGSLRYCSLGIPFLRKMEITHLEMTRKTSAPSPPPWRNMTEECVHWPLFSSRTASQIVAASVPATTCWRHRQQNSLTIILLGQLGLQGPARMAAPPLGIQCFLLYI